jgi:hypothetical protein
MTRRAVVALLALLTGSAALHAQPVPTIDAPAPLSIQRGQPAELTLGGGGLAGVTSVALTKDAAIAAELVRADGQPNDGQARVRLTAAPDAWPGVRELRLVSPAGVSNPITVWVDQYPLAEDKEPNNAPDVAQAVTLPAVLSGRIEAAGDADLYRFAAKKGQQLIFNLHAARAGSGLDANLLLYDAATGRELASNNDTFGADPFLAFAVPADGDYAIEVRDLQYRGAGDYAYRIEAGEIPFVQSLSPMSSRRGTVVDVRPVGFNLAGAETVHLDLTHAKGGRIPLRVRTAAGLSNEVAFEVTELPQGVEAEPNDAPAAATAAALPSDLSGVIGAANDADFFRFKLEQPTRLLIEAVARRLGSPLDPLLTLHDAAGNPIALNDDAAGADARIGRDLPAGEYLLSIRDVGYNGGPAHAYRIAVQSTLQPPDGPPQDFALRVQPDAARINRGSTTKLWCDVGRLNFPADVSLAVEGLPPGVTVSSPTVFPPVTSGLLMLTAAPDAAVGTFPITIKATALYNGELVTRVGQPELPGGRIVRQAYLTVLDAAPFTVQPLATLPLEHLQQMTGEYAALSAKMLQPSPELQARQAEWEQKVVANPAWTVLDIATFTSEGRANLVKHPDGSILSTGDNPQTEIHTLVAHTDLKGVVAVRLECLTDPSLPGNGPGRSGAGNFVLNRFAATSAPKADPAKAAPVTFARAQATFSQGGYDVAGAIDGDAGTGWAIFPEVGKNQTALFFAKEPVGGDGGTVLTFTMEEHYGGNHVIGRFRLSVSTDPAAADAPAVPEHILAIARVPAGQRSAEQKAQIAAHYESIDPMLSADRNRLALLRTVVAPRAEIARLEPALSAQTPQLDAEQAQWEQAALAGAAWTPLDTGELRSAGGASFAREADGSIFVFGAAPPTDTYTVIAPTAAKAITGLRIEALPDPRLPNNGPGRAPDGNFVLSGIKVAVAPVANPAGAQPVEIANSTATFQQENYGLAGALDDKTETGWAIHPMMGRPAGAELWFKAPQGADGGSVFTVTLDHQSSATPQFALGRFRVSLTTAPQPAAAAALPPHVLTILRTPAAARNDEQKAALAAYHRSIARSLEPVRQRLAELNAQVAPFPVVAQRGRASQLPVFINRGGGFPSGDVRVTLEGFSLGREGPGPAPIGRSLKLTPLTIAGGDTFGTVGFTAEPSAEQGTRLVVIRAEAKVGNDTVVQYSPAFPLTVN